MLETVVLSVAAVGGVAILGLMFYAARQADSNLQRRVQDAEAGERPLSVDERAAVQVRGYQPIPPNEDGGGWYARYRRRNALARTHVRFGMLLFSYMAAFALVVDLLGVPLGFITMYLLGQVAVGLYVLRRRSMATDRRP
jgi:Flp pilus assembly protein TadB